MVNITFEDGDEKIERSHIESALGYIGEYGEEENGMLYIPYDGEGGLGKGKPQTRELRDKGKRFWIKDVVRIAYLYADGVYPSPKFNQEDIGRVKVNLKWKPDGMKKFLRRKGYTDFGDESEYKEKTEIDWEKITFNDVKNSIKREYAESALRYFEDPHGLFEKTENGILYVYKKGVPETRALCHKGLLCGLMEVVRIAYLYSIEYDINQENLRRVRRIISGSKGEKWTSDEAETLLRQWYTDFRRIPKGIINNQKSSAEKLPEIFRQFYQIILHGPPGTGKTYRAKMEFLPKLLGINIEGKNEYEIKELLKEEQGVLWDIVQFHPSYNYEDFVRGVKVTTDEDNNIAYKTENRIFGKMCQHAKNDPDNNYILIIDEINRANVSAVLGELIYALEYRGGKIKTPYIVDGTTDAMLIIPKNLYIIGTMNNADRTIGQIDYAVRRRFAFVHCPPNREVITEHVKDKRVWQIYDDVQELFKRREEQEQEQEYLSQDYDAEDVRIGHSYFLHDAERTDISRDMQISQKIIYQVVPILREYVKDGVLLSEAKEKINKIEEDAMSLSSNEAENENNDSAYEEEDTSPGSGYFFWEKDGRHSDALNQRKLVLSIVRDYLKNNPNITVKELKDWFPDKGKYTNKNRGIKSEGESFDKSRFFVIEGLKVEGKTVYVTTQWGYKGGNASGERGSFEDFIKDIKESGYIIREKD